MKPHLVLVSGLLSNEFLWYHQSHHLDHVASVHIVSPTEDTPEKMVATILKAAPPVFALAGHSMGGWLCLEVMRAAPDRVSKLCLLNTTARSDTAEKKASRKKMIDEAKSGHFLNVVEELTAKFVYNERYRAEVKKMFLDVGKEAFIRQEESMISRRETLSVLQMITCPTLVVHAAQDNVFTLDDHMELVNTIPNAKFAVVEDSGHMSPLEVPQAISALMRCWLT